MQRTNRAYETIRTRLKPVEVGSPCPLPLDPRARLGSCRKTAHTILCCQGGFMPNTNHRFFLEVQHPESTHIGFFEASIAINQVTGRRANNPVH
jgi:hypothetical protein